MLPDKFYMPYTDDKRMNYASDYLVNRGFTAAENADVADFILLPVPTKQYMLDEYRGKLCFHGGGICANGFDYLKNEAYLLKNAYLTAEGAIACLEENTLYSLLNLNYLIIGYGRIGKAFHSLLAPYSSSITVCSRSKSSAVTEEFNGASHISLEELKNKSGFDIVINTVPHIVLTKPELEALKPSCVILDLASFPGGVDNLVANSLGITVLNGRGMPSRFTVKTAGELIGEAVIDIIEEEFA